MNCKVWGTSGKSKLPKWTKCQISPNFQYFSSKLCFFDPIWLWFLLYCRKIVFFTLLCPLWQTFENIYECLWPYWPKFQFFCKFCHFLAWSIGRIDRLLGKSDSAYQKTPVYQIWQFLHKVKWFAISCPLASVLLWCLGIPVTICWIPSHIGVSGNEIVDHLAKEALSNNDIQCPLKPSVHELYQIIEEGILKEWQVFWDLENKGRFYHRIQPQTSYKVKYSDEHKEKQTAITHLRLGKSCSNDVSYQ